MYQMWAVSGQLSCWQGPVFGEIHAERKGPVGQAICCGRPGDQRALSRHLCQMSPLRRLHRDMSERCGPEKGISQDAGSLTRERAPAKHLAKSLPGLTLTFSTEDDRVISPTTANEDGLEP